ncbi:MAG: PAS domain S-box protein [Pseudomonadota bacterium]
MQLPIESQAYLVAIITSSDDAIISKDLKGNITSWNPAAERIFGYMAEEAIGKHISLIIPPDRLSDEDYILGKIKAGERVEHFEAIRRKKDGQLINLSITVSPIKNSKGDIIGASKIARDITFTKEAERTAAYLSAIIESSDDAIISKDLNGFITSWNKSAERIFGYTPEEIIGRHITILIPSERIHEEDTILSTLKSGNRLEHFETMRRHKLGHLIPVSLTVSPIRDIVGNVVGASKVARDITDRIYAEKAIREMSLKKDEFLANMSHELRTPMNAVIGLTNLLQRMDLPEKAHKFIETLQLSADNLMELINDLLDFAKIESDSLEIEQIEFNLAEQVEKAISVMNVKAHEKNLSLFVNYPSSLNRYYIGDPLRVHQILMNLLSNAVKFTDQGSIKVDVSGAHSSPDITLLTLKVTDTGIGIPQNKLETIFDKFMQADSSITRRFGGSGLGLSIVKALVHKMNGTLNVHSEEGLGTSFTVTLPLKTTQRTYAVESFSAGPLPQTLITGKNVLLVEDYEPNIIVAEAMLQQMNYDYDLARNGVEALRKFAHGHYDAILMDVQMPEVDGLEATRRIRRLEKERGLHRTPIIAMTAHVREQDKEKCFDAGMDNFIPKPIDPIELSNKIMRYVNLSKEMVQLGIASIEKNE